jgi:hypothetical protein
VTLTSGVQPSTAAMAFFVKYGGVLSMVDPAHEVTPADSGESQGLSFASFTQSEGQRGTGGRLWHPSHDGVRLGRAGARVIWGILTATRGRNT